nr:hypothetical protein [Paenibacillus dendrobii]
MIRGLLGETKAGDAKQLDMKTGQVVRGVVLSVSEDGQEAVVQIQGVKVKAALETPMQAGQATLLQVQPPASNGMMVLKPLAESPYSAIPSQSMADVLGTLGLADTDENRTMIQAMQSSGVPLNKENAELFSRIMQQKPASVPTEQWIQSAAIALQRGLPVTAESVRGLQQAVFGQPLHELLAVLDEQLEAAQTMHGPVKPAASGDAGAANRLGQISHNSSVTQVGLGVNQQENIEGASAKGQAAQTGGQVLTASDGHAAPAEGLQPLLAKLQQVLQQLRTAPLAGSALAAQQGNAETAGRAAALPATGMAPPTQQAALTGSGPAGGPEPMPPQAPGAEPWVGRLLKLLGAEHEQQGLRGAGMPAQEPGAAAGNARPVVAAPAAGQGAAPQATGQAEPGPVNPAGGTASAAAAAARQPAPATAPGSGAVPQQPAGEIAAGQEQQARTLQAAGLHTAATSIPAGETAGIRTEHALHGSGAQDTLKGILLQLVNHDEVPPALKEAAQQLVSHLTGQQLLLNTDRTAPFAQVTLFLPLNGPDGQETASVQIQSRRGPKGELDASNCRLWFDLQMKHLGQTLVDVQVVDRIVSLKVHNDADWAGELLINHKDEISAAMESLGYQLLTLRAEPMPVKAAESTQGTTTAAAVHDYVPQSYKGVDFRV